MSKLKHNTNPKVAVSNSAPLQALLVIGPILVVIGAIAYSIQSLSAYSGWIVAVGGLVGAIGSLISASRGKELSPRIRRLDRMFFLGLLLFLVSGGFMIQGSSSWFAIFAVGAVFYIYAVFAKDRALKMEVK